MSTRIIFSLFPVMLSFFAFAQNPTALHTTVDLKSADGTLLKATYFPAANSGPGVLLFHQSNRTRQSWEGVARQLSAFGINVLTVDSRGMAKAAATRKTQRSGGLRTRAGIQVFGVANRGQPRCHWRRWRRSAGRRKRGRMRAGIPPR